MRRNNDWLATALTVALTYGFSYVAFRKAKQLEAARRVKGASSVMSESQGSLGRVSHGYEKIGRIKASVARASRSDLVKAGDIALGPTAMDHIEKFHGAQWRQLGWEPEAIVRHIARGNFDFIQEGNEKKKTQEQEAKEANLCPPVNKPLRLVMRCESHNFILVVKPYIDIDDRARLSYAVLTCFPEDAERRQPNVLWPRVATQSDKP